MKIMQINSVYNYGSTGRIVKDIDSVLRESGHESYVMYGRHKKANSKTIRFSGSLFDFFFDVLLTRLFDSHGKSAQLNTIKVIKQIKKVQPDLIHIHNLHGYYINYTMLLKFINRKKIPLVMTLHDCWTFTGHCSYYTFVGCGKWKDQCEKCPQLSAYPKSVFRDNSKNNYIKKKSVFSKISNLHLVTPSHWLKKEIEQSFLSSKKCTVIHNGIDLNVFRPRKNHGFIREKYKDKFIILGVASKWEERKGLEFFLELSKNLELNEVIVLVGLTKSQISMLPHNIIGLLRTSTVDELSQIYSDSDIFINPTLEDNFPTTNIEALACGTPVITFPTGGSPEAVDSFTGVVTSSCNVGEIRSSIKLIQSNPNRFSPTNCRKRAVALFDKNDRYQDYISLYKHLI